MLLGVKVSTVNVVVALIEPGAINVDGVDNVTEPVDADASIWLEVPAIDLTTIFAIVIVPAASVIEIAVTSVDVAHVYPVALPINN